MSTSNTSKSSSPSQLDKFKELARELEADESEERFEDQIRRMARKPAPVQQKPED